LFVIGHLSYRKYTDSNGVEKWVTEIVADRIELCGSKAEQSPVSPEVHPQQVPSKPVLDDIGDLPDDELPF
jgi:single-strand DNA-binding protein